MLPPSHLRRGGAKQQQLEFFVLYLFVKTIIKVTVGTNNFSTQLQLVKILAKTSSPMVEKD